MPQIALTITPPDRAWVAEVSSVGPDATIKILAAVPGERTGFSLARITGPDFPEIAEAMNDHEQITEVTPIQWSENEVTLHFEAVSPFLFQASRDSGIVVDFPVVIEDGEATLEATGSRERLSTLVDHLDELGVGYRIDYIGERRDEERVVSERQLEFVAAALECGYYDTPRRCSLTELAETLGVAKSTCSETLHRAEEAMVKRFVSALPEAGVSESPSIEN